jgi:hypothetical protein
MGLGVDASIPTWGGRGRVQPIVGLGVDASRSNMLLPPKKNHIVDLNDKIKINNYYYNYLSHKYYHFYYN